MSVPRIWWTCPCGVRLKLQPSRARKRVTCSVTCPKRRHEGGKRAAQNRVRRVMLQFGFDEAQALAFCRGWLAGRIAAQRAAQRARRAPRLGTSEWFRVQGHLEASRQSRISRSPQAQRQG